MLVDRTDTLRAPNGVTYDRTHYHCTYDDCWVTVEKPIES
jgi:hypothetical protein